MYYHLNVLGKDYVPINGTLTRETRININITEPCGTK
jgi:hypothetical protein